MSDAEGGIRFLYQARELSRSIDSVIEAGDLDETFRFVHSIKSMAGQIGLDALSMKAHEVETELENARASGDGFASPVRQTVRIWLAELERALDALEQSQRAPADAPVLSAFEEEILAESVRRGERFYRLECSIDPESPLKVARAHLVVNNLELVANVIRTDPPLSEPDESRFGTISVLLTADIEEERLYEAANVDEVDRIRLERVQPGNAPSDVEDDHDEKRSTSSSPSGPYRVDARTMAWISAQMDEADSVLSRLSVGEGARLGRLRTILGALRETFAAIQRRSVGSLFDRLKTTAEELAESVGKRVEIVTWGDQVVVDTRVIEAVSDPLLHLVRNAVDHGVEPREERVAAGKSACGRIELRAEDLGAQIAFSVRDDGRGMDREKLIEEARSRSIVVSGDESVRDIIGTPGFSTVDSPTDLSGRGFGLDIVIQRVEAIGGTVEVTTKAGVGTTIRITAPTLSHVGDSLIVRCNGNFYAVPAASVERMLPFDASALRRDRGGGIWFERVPVYTVSGRMTVSSPIPKTGMVVLVRYLERTGWLYVDDVLFERKGGEATAGGGM